MTVRVPRAARRPGAPALAVACALVAGGCTRPAPSAGPGTVTSPAVPTAAPVTAPITAPATFPTLPPATTPLECVHRLPLDVRAGQVLMAAVDGDDLGGATSDVTAGAVGGLILMSWPAGADPAALRSLADSTPIPMLLATDEEGGQVQRLRSLGRLPAAADVAATMTPAEARAMIAVHADAVAAFGIDIVFAPDVDVAPPDAAGPIGDRSFGSDPDTVVTYAQAYIDAWQAAGVMPVIKHLPGHGRASADTHAARAVTPPLAELEARDLVPFAALATEPGVGVMVGHLDVPGLTDADGVPASLSPAAITGLLRDTLGAHDALVFTDALDMDAIASTWGVPDAAVQAIGAGADVALFTERGIARDVRAAIVAAVGSGRLSEARLDAAVAHVLAAKHLDACGIG